MTGSTDALKQQLHTLRQTVGYLRERAATVGGEVFLPLGDRHSLRDAREGIAACKAELRARGVLVDDEPEDAAPAAPGQTPAGGIFQLRAPVADFTGRDAELTRLVRALRLDHGGRAAAISGVRGMGGLGKTELAHAVAAQLRDHYPDGQILLDLAGAHPTPLSPAQALQQVIRAFRPEDKLLEEVPALQKLYRSLLAGRRVLILADDARDTAQVRSLLPPAGSALLVTSRQRFVLDGMTLLDLERLEKDAAVALLRGICPRLTEDQAHQIALLCGYLPLALRVSAGILFNDEALSIERYLNRLADERQRLAHLKDPDDPDRDVGANLLLSYAALDVQGQAVFCRLGVLASDANLALIAAVLELSEDQADEVLRTLLRRSLVEYDPARNRWGMHALVRACALGLLIKTGEERAARLRYAEQVITLIKQADHRYRSGGDGVLAGLALFDRERAHLEAVRIWLWAQPPDADIDALVIRETGVTAFVGGLRNPLRTVRVPQVERALALARRQGDRAGEGRALGILGNAYSDLGALRRAIALYEQRLVITRELGDRADEAYVLNRLGRAHLLQGDIDEALARSASALTLARDTNNRLIEGMTLHTIAAAHAALGQLAEADATFTASLALLESIKHAPQLARTRWAYGQFLVRQGDRERGISLMAACVAYEEGIGHAKVEEHAALVEHLRAGGDLPG